MSGAGLALRLPADAYWQLVHTLRLTLPPPLGDSAEDLLRRDHAAIARIAALAPANAAEADVAAQFVAASEQWKDCLRLAQLPETLPRAPKRGTPDGHPARSTDFSGCPEWAAKCRAQAIAMMRQSQSALRLLLRMQDARRKVEKDGAAADRLVWSEHCAASLMAEALSQHPHPGPLAEADGEGAIFPLPSGEGLGAGNAASAAISGPAPPPVSPPDPERLAGEQDAPIDTASGNAPRTPGHPETAAGPCASRLGNARPDAVSKHDLPSRHAGIETAVRRLTPSRLPGAAPGRAAIPAVC